MTFVFRKIACMTASFFHLLESEAKPFDGDCDRRYRQKIGWQMMALRAACIGECMIELNQREVATLALAFGGDTLNTAVYLARVNSPSRFHVDYITALGDDPYSDAMIAMWQGEGLGIASVARLPGKLPGLYLIRIDDKGERRFFYYRSAAAARELFTEATTLPLLAALSDYDLLYFSAITLSILSATARDRFFAALTTARAKGSRVAFDSNYRPAGWPDPATARQVIGRFLTCVDIALPTFDDEALLFDDSDAETTARRYAQAGVKEIAVKLGAAGCLLDEGGKQQHVAVAQPLKPVDTTAAGDSFNAGYLSFRLAGKSPREAALAGHRLAAAKIGYRGALMPRDAMPDLGL
ncbi:MAG TPA: sugar kinase [Stellaceae bacterium]|nr:sugar kinase [Stellaceae bacterium]